MSRTNTYTSYCSRCGSTVPPRTGTIRYYNGAARKHAPKYATRTPYGVIVALTCLKCEDEIQCTS